jgi:hypothetical protein
MKYIDAPPRLCAECGASFQPSASNHWFCTSSCQKANQKRRRSAKCPDTKNCLRCEKPFHPESNRQIYCSRNCRQGSRICENCGKDFSPSRNAMGRFCKPQCFYDSGVPIGTERPSGGGYTIVKVPRDTPGAKLQGMGRANWMWTHRYVMQQKLGRPLEKHERVHHINGVRDDNRPDNLELWEHSHPSGVRRIDGIKNAILELPASQRTQLLKWLQSIQD